MSRFHVYSDAHGAVTGVGVRKIEVGDLYDCLRSGYADFLAKPSHTIFIVLLYPLIGVFLAAWTSGANALPMLFPLASGFALLGPLAALGLYEISRRRELGLDASLRHALEVRHSPALLSIAAVGAMLLAIFIAWLLVAQQIYFDLFGQQVPTSLGAFASQVFGTNEGWTLLVVGNVVGLLFAILVLSTTVIAFPLLLDRDVGAYAAVSASVRATATNPVPMAVWGLIVAVLLIIGSLPLFAGLVVVLPVLGHATWHLYRKVTA